MRTKFACVMVLTMAWAAIGTGQELLWQGSFEEGTVRVTQNTLSAKRTTTIPETGFPLTISRWDPEVPCYASRMVMLSPSGTYMIKAADDVDYFGVVPDPDHARWFVGASELSATKALNGVEPLDLANAPDRKWQLDMNRFATRSGYRTYVVDTISGHARLLAGDLGFVEVVAADNGSIAMTGMGVDGLIILRVYDADGQVIYQKTTASVHECLRYMNMDAAGSFVEISVGSVVPYAGKGWDFHTRLRIDLSSKTEQVVEHPLPGGRIKARGADIAIWADRNMTLVHHLGSDGHWREVDLIPEQVFIARTLAGGAYVLAFRGGDDERTIFYTHDGDPMLEVRGLASPFDVTQHGSGLVVVHSLGQTTVLDMPETGGVR